MVGADYSLDISPTPHGLGVFVRDKSDCIEGSEVEGAPNGLLE